jgi:integrase
LRRQKGEGTWYKEDGYFKWRLTSNGDTKKLSSTTLKSLKEKVNTFQRGVAKSGGFVPQGEKTPLGDYLDYWIENTVKPSRSLKTYSGYETMVRLYLKPSLGRIPLGKLTSVKIRCTITELLDKDREVGALSPRTVGYALSVLKVALRDAVRESPPLISVNAALPVQSPKLPPPRKRTLTSEQIRAIEGASTKSRYRPMIMLLICTGARISEAMAWTWQDTSDESFAVITRKLEWVSSGRYQFASVKKAKSVRRVPLGEMARRAIAEIRSQQAIDASRPGYQSIGLIFTTELGGPIIERNLQRALDSILQSLNFSHIGLHDLRKTCGSELARNRVPLNIVQDILGHESITTTQFHYLDVSSDDLKQAAEIFR